MGTHRTGGMTAIGVLNIIFGALGGLVGLLVVLGGGFMAGGGAMMGAEGSDEAGMMGGGLAAMGGLVMLLGLGTLTINLLLLIGGIGVLKVAPWGRTLSIAYGALGVLIYGATLTGGVTLTNVIALGYCLLLLWLFFRPTWKAAFTAGHHDTMMHGRDDEDQREAA